MKRPTHLITIALLASSLACGTEGGSAGRTGGHDRSTGSGMGGAGGNTGTEGGGRGGSQGGIQSLAGGGGAGSGGVRNADNPDAGSSLAGSGSMGINDAGAVVSSQGGSAGAAGNAGGMGGQPGTGGNGGTAPSGGRTGVGGTTGTGGASAIGGRSAGTSATGGRSAGTSSGTGNPVGSNCTTCHGDSAAQDPAPPSDTKGNTETSFPGVGAHGKHLAVSTWHRQGKCVDCHKPPTAMMHANGTVDFTWGTPSNAKNATPSFDTTSLTCAGAYCHGTTLPGASTAKTAPVWNQVNGTWSACGTACHATPPAASTGHPASQACEKCHSKVIASFEGTSAQTTWKDASLHINGTVEVDTLTCTSCHGSGSSPAPPKDTQGGTATTAAGVGAHAQHLGTSTWHRQGQCADCHKTPTSTAHANNTVDFSWGTPSNASNATPSFNAAALSCGGTYCHGAKMTDQSASVGRVPVWTKVDGTHDACGKACHANPPSSGSHTSTSTACQSCHGDVIASFNGASSTWKNPALHINGKVEATAQTCSSCHGNPPTTGTHRRRDHQVACTNCHPNPSGTTHRNGRTDQTCSSNRAGCHDDD